jgi:aminoglycoside phosphotransferase family enzyme/predicted kinase
MSPKKAPNSSLVLISALCAANAYSLIETHISWIILTGHYAYKIKKPVNLGFLDFSTLENRRYYCNEELRLNRRLAPDWYLEVVMITGTPDQPQLNGTGNPIEYAVKMLQFPPGQLLSDYAKRQQLIADHIDQISNNISSFHDIIAQTDPSSSHGDSNNIIHWFTDNFNTIRPLLLDDQKKQQLHRIQHWGDNIAPKLANLMKLRKVSGHVRECHGDLHLGNMTLINDKVIVFDCIEFNPQLRWIDVLSDVAFLFIDLLRFSYAKLAYRFINRYLQHTGDYQDLTLLRFYLVYRALVRAKVTLLRRSQQHNTVITPALDEYVTFADLAERMTLPQPTALIITHGYSGSGKSTMTAKLAEKIGAIQIRSDIERKRLFGYQAETKTHSDIVEGIYSQQASVKTYQHLTVLAKSVLEAGFTAIIDATFLKTAQREQYQKIAMDCGVPFFIIDFQASDVELCDRIRQRQNDASEATAAILMQQKKSAQPLSNQEQSHVITVNTESKTALGNLLDRFSVLQSFPD